MKVDFLIAGAQRGGTTALDTYLRKHPDICMAKLKELHFFDNDDWFSTNNPDYLQYHANFPGVHDRPHVRISEATPIYMYWREVPKRIHQYNPRMKFIASLRNPIERANSHWNMQRALKTDPAPFDEALQLEAIRRQATHPLQQRAFSYTDRGFYLEQLERIFRYFPRSQVLILRSEEIKSNPQRILDRICQFLDVSRLQLDIAVAECVVPYLARIGMTEWQYLHRLFENEIRSLERLMGWDCSDWLRQPENLIA